MPNHPLLLLRIHLDPRFNSNWNTLPSSPFPPPLLPLYLSLSLLSPSLSLTLSYRPQRTQLRKASSRFLMEEIKHSLQLAAHRQPCQQRLQSPRHCWRRNGTKEKEGADRRRGRGRERGRRRGRRRGREDGRREEKVKRNRSDDWLCNSELLQLLLQLTRSWDLLCQPIHSCRQIWWRFHCPQWYGERSHRLYWYVSYPFSSLPLSPLDLSSLVSSSSCIVLTHLQNIWLMPVTRTTLTSHMSSATYWVSLIPRAVYPPQTPSCVPLVVATTIPNSTAMLRRGNKRRRGDTINQPLLAWFISSTSQPANYCQYSLDCKASYATV